LLLPTICLGTVRVKVWDVLEVEEDVLGDAVEVFELREATGLLEG
jgi:hypothetical protein